ncbi:hypothetical protein SGUI_1831 [Serinicoccus hydrothermalis]|uniref:Uncharacterized protein n=1 Tax=Serinicoccus hydrothermalis TaxID=1758689 RepID=A0A1B1NCR4_9MICO|nr:hypothetical protein [Serinicoccus hydrothermalis]ANS79227.1 hypothetical protein SGUI_1831 [Serinicoccus hydrothermalis]
MTYRYGRDWHPVLRKPIQEITEKKARQRWASGPQFSVSQVDDEGSVPAYTLVVMPEGSFVRSERYDEHGSVVSAYHFDLIEGSEDQLFLHQVTEYVYPDRQTGYLAMNAAKAHTTFNFRPNGWARARFVVDGQPEARVEEYTGVDVSAHWVERPAFGDWDRLGADRAPEPPG